MAEGHLFLYKKHEKSISQCEKKWIYKHKGFDDKLFKELFFQPGTNITEKSAHWKHGKKKIMGQFSLKWAGFMYSPLISVKGIVPIIPWTTG